MAQHRSHIKFIKGFINNPKDTGSIIPSSVTLAKEMFRSLPVTNFKLAVEFGPGTGVLTREAIKILPNDCQLILVEKSEEFVNLLRDRFLDQQIFHGNAQDINKILGTDAGSVDIIFSGLPFTNFPKNLSQEILRESKNALRTGGRFRTFIYLHNVWLPKMTWFRQQLQQTFSKVETYTVYRNFPPALIFDCQK